jgi:chloramphenicol 3-O-phosphotransferase
MADQREGKARQQDAVRTAITAWADDRDTVRQDAVPCTRRSPKDPLDGRFRTEVCFVEVECVVDATNSDSHDEWRVVELLGQRFPVHREGERVPARKTGEESDENEDPAGV